MRNRVDAHFKYFTLTPKGMTVDMVCQHCFRQETPNFMLCLQERSSLQNRNSAFMLSGKISLQLLKMQHESDLYMKTPHVSYMFLCAVQTTQTHNHVCLQSWKTGRYVMLMKIRCTWNMHPFSQDKRCGNHAWKRVGFALKGFANRGQVSSNVNCCERKWLDAKMRSRFRIRGWKLRCLTRWNYLAALQKKRELKKCA